MAGLHRADANAGVLDRQRKLRLLAAAGGRADWAAGNGLPGDYSIYFESWERAADSGNVEEWCEETPSAARWYSPPDMAFLWLGTDPSPARIALIYDIFGNPFRPVKVNLAWQTPTVLALATAAYENRILPAGTLDSARLAILADALEEAGCDNADMLNHCRQPGVHVRGCWVVDAILASE